MVDKFCNSRRVCCGKVRLTTGIPPGGTSLTASKAQRKPESGLGENKRMDKKHNLKKGFLCACVSL